MSESELSEALNGNIEALKLIIKLLDECLEDWDQLPDATKHHLIDNARHKAANVLTATKGWADVATIKKIVLGDNED